MQQEFSIQVEAKAFLLRPDTPPEGIPRDGGGGALQEPLATYARESGLTMVRSSLTPYSQLALEASEFAKEQGAFDSFHRAAYRAYWAEGQNIGNAQVLLDLAQQTGLDAAALGQALHERRYQPAVLQQFEEAQELGIHGIPAFLVERYLFTGAQPYPVFQRVARTALTEMEKA